MGIKKKEFRVERRYADGTAAEPQIHRIDGIDADWNMGRRDFLATTALGVAALGVLGASGCSSTGTTDTGTVPFSGECAGGLKSHPDAITGFIVHPDGEMLLSASTTQVAAWELPSGKPLESVAELSRVNAIALSSDGKTLAAGGDGYPFLFDLPSMKARLILTPNATTLTDLAFTPDGKILVAAPRTGPVIFYPMSGDKERVTEDPLSRPSFSFKPRDKTVTGIKISPDGTVLAALHRDMTISLIGIPSGKIVQIITDTPDACSTMTISPDGATLVAGFQDKSLRTYALPSGKRLLESRGLEGQVNALAWSPDGRILAAGVSSPGNGIMLFRPGEAKPYSVMKAHTDSVNSLAFTPDGRTLVSGSRDGTLLAWNPATGALLKTLPGHAGGVSRLAVSPDGETVVSAGGDSQIKSWSLKSGAQIACFFGPASLSEKETAKVFRKKNESGETAFYSVSSETKLPGGSVCTCNTVKGTLKTPAAERPYGGDTGGGRGYCTCNKICTCVPVK
ncbi:MAG: WD40 repeat domain-containing protein [Spirochaetes bacterium]|nr:MAG: WD40 repeat domain-containing protein [Spirochaetota bacterium]